MPTTFVIKQSIAELTVITVTALSRAYDRHMRMPGNRDLQVFLYASEYFSHAMLDKIETTLNTYYGSTVAESLEGPYERNPPSRESLEQMLPDPFFEELYKCFMPYNKRDYEVKLAAVVSASIAEKSISSQSIVALPYWQLVIENVNKNVRVFLSAAPEKDPAGHFMPYHGGLRPNVPLGLKGLVQMLVKPWINEDVLSALRDTFTVNERQITTLGAWMDQMESALTRLRKSYNPIAAIASACNKAETARRKVQTTKNIASTSLNAMLSMQDMDQIAYQLELVDSDLEVDDHMSNMSLSSDVSAEVLHNASDGRRPQMPAMGAGKGPDSDQVCFRTVQGLSCDPKKCVYSHDQAKICKYLNTALQRFDVTNKHSVKNVKAVKIDPLVKTAEVELEQQLDSDAED